MNLELIHAIEKMGNVKIRIEDENMHVDSSLDLEGCIGLTELPENLHVDSWLDLSGCTGLTKLPAGLSVDGCLYLSGCTGLKSNDSYVISNDIGSRNNKTVYFVKTDIVKCGCFAGTLDEFEKRVHDVYPSGKYREQYDEYIELCRNSQINNN